MKKYSIFFLALLVFATSFSFAVKPASALTLEDLQASIVKLEKRVSLLESANWQMWDPLIGSVTNSDETDQFYPGVWVKMKGSRLTTDVKITSNDGKTTIVPENISNVYNDGTRVDFKVPSSIAVGPYYINVYSSNGRKSNTLPFRIVNQQSICVPEGGSLGPVVPSNTKVCCPGLVEKPAPGGAVGVRGTCATPSVEVAPRISEISGNFYPDGWIKLSGARLTTDVKIVDNYDSSKIVVPLNISDVNGDGSRIDFKLPSDMKVGAYYLNVYSKTGLKSPTMPFRVMVRPTTSAKAKANQLANLNSALQSILDQLKAQ